MRGLLAAAGAWLAGLWLGGNLMLLLTAQVAFTPELVELAREQSGDLVGALLGRWGLVAWGICAGLSTCMLLLFAGCWREQRRGLAAVLLLGGLLLPVTHGAGSVVADLAHEARLDRTAGEGKLQRERYDAERFQFLHKLSVRVFGVETLLILLAGPGMLALACTPRRRDVTEQDS